MSRFRGAEQLALGLLHSHHIVRAPVNVEAIAEADGVEVVYEKLESEVSGMLVRTEDGRATISVNSRHHPNRQRFTLAHELAHFHLHQNTPTMFVDGRMIHFRAVEEARSPRVLQEAEANAFAGALLMPPDLLREDLRSGPIDAFDDEAVQALAMRYCVSPQALTIRLMELGLLRGLATKA